MIEFKNDFFEILCNSVLEAVLNIKNIRLAGNSLSIKGKNYDKSSFRDFCLGNENYKPFLSGLDEKRQQDLSDRVFESVVDSLRSNLPAAPLTNRGGKGETITVNEVYKVWKKSDVSKNYIWLCDIDNSDEDLVTKSLFCKITDKSSDGRVVQVYPLLPKNGIGKITSCLWDINQDLYNKRHAEELYEFMNYNSRLHTMTNIKTVWNEEYPSENDDMVYTYMLVKKTDPSPQIPNSWNEILSRMSDPVAFSAWIWSIFEGKHTGRQVLVLWGIGKNGKSTIFRILREKMKNLYASIDSRKLSKSDKYGLSTLLGKRLMVDCDNSSKNILGYDKIRTITSGDSVSIEEKYASAIEASIYGRVAIGTNHKPNVSSDLSQTSRLLFIEMEPFNPKVNKTNYNTTADFQKALSDEFSDYLKYCRYCYNKVCPDDDEIISESNRQYIAEKADEESITILRNLEKTFEINKNKIKDGKFSIRREEFKSIVDEHDVLKNYTLETIKRVLFEYGLKDFGNKNGGQVKTGEKKEKRYRGIKSLYPGTSSLVSDFLESRNSSDPVLPTPQVDPEESIDSIVDKEPEKPATITTTAANPSAMSPDGSPDPIEYEITTSDGKVVKLPPESTIKKYTGLDRFKDMPTQPNYPLTTQGRSLNIEGNTDCDEAFLNHVARFLRDNWKAYVFMNDLHKLYSDWCGANGLSTGGKTSRELCLNSPAGWQVEKLEGSEFFVCYPPEEDFSDWEEEDFDD